MPYFVVIFRPQADGKEQLVASSMMERAHETDRDKLIDRMALVAPDTPGTYVVRLQNATRIVSETYREIF